MVYSYYVTVGIDCYGSHVQGAHLSVEDVFSLAIAFSNDVIDRVANYSTVA